MVLLNFDGSLFFISPMPRSNFIVDLVFQEYLHPGCSKPGYLYRIICIRSQFRGFLHCPHETLQETLPWVYVFHSLYSQRDRGNSIHDLHENPDV